jgi:vacuolar-type H+-ATPase subunit E/Vma4
MALDELLATLTRGAEEKVADLLREAREHAAATQSTAAEARRRRLDGAVGAHRGALDAALEQAVTDASREASRSVLRVREEVLARVVAEARARLQQRRREPLVQQAAAALLASAASYIRAEGGVVRCAADAREALEPVARAHGLELVLDEELGPGSVLRTRDDRLAVDATLERHLMRGWPDEAIRVAARLESSL